MVGDGGGLLTGVAVPSDCSTMVAFDRFGRRMFDEYMGMVAARARLSTVLGTAYGVKVFCLVVGKSPEGSPRWSWLRSSVAASDRGGVQWCGSVPAWRGSSRARLCVVRRRSPGGGSTAIVVRLA